LGVRRKRLGRKGIAWEKRRRGRVCIGGTIGKEHQQGESLNSMRKEKGEESEEECVPSLNAGGQGEGEKG